MGLREHAPLAVPAVLFSASLWLRLVDLDATCLWFDEIFSSHAASQPLGSLFSFVAQDLIHPPLFYLVLKLWMAIGGDGAAWLRGLSLFWFALSMVPAFLLLRELKQNIISQSIALSSLVVNGQLFKYSLEVRMYSQLACLAAFSLWLYVRAGNRNTGWLVLTIVNILLVYTHYYGWLVVVAELGATVVLYREHVRRFALVAASCVIAFVPWVWMIAAYANGPDAAQNIAWVKSPGPRELILFAIGLVEPFYYQTSSDASASIWIVSVPVLVLVAVSGMVCYLSRQPRESRIDRGLLLVGMMFVLPTLTSFAVSWMMPQSIWGIRHLLIAFLPFAVMVGFAISSLGTRVRRVTLSALALLAVCGLMIRLSQERTPAVWCQFDELALESKAIDPLPIYTLEDLAAYHIWNSTGRNSGDVNRIRGGFGLPEDTAYFLPRGFGDVRVVDEDEVKDRKFFLIYRSRGWDENEPPLRNLQQKGLRFTQIGERQSGRERAFLVQVQPSN